MYVIYVRFYFGGLFWRVGKNNAVLDAKTVRVRQISLTCLRIIHPSHV